MKINTNVSFNISALLICVALSIFSCTKEVIKNLPVVTIEAVTDITTNSATSGGDISINNGQQVISRGVCWSLNQNPTTLDLKTIDGAGTGSFTSSITDLTPGANYYIRAYAINSDGTAYSSQSTFTTLAIVLFTNNILNITQTSASSGGNILNDGGSSITARGVCWSTNKKPTIADNKTIDGTGTGNFTSILSGLNPGTTYYVRSYATVSEGTAYGDESSFMTRTLTGTFTDSRDMKSYKWVKIGNQIWMAENLNYSLTGSWWNLNNSNNGNIYGRLYTWRDANMACPSGWHLPSDDEWITLEIFIGMSPAVTNMGGPGRGTDEGEKLKSKNGWNGTDVYGFNALPGGLFFSVGFLAPGSNCCFWTSSEYGGGFAWSRSLESENKIITRAPNDEYGSGFSVRCIKD